jgi:hypothetical protein
MGVGLTSYIAIRVAAPTPRFIPYLIFPFVIHALSRSHVPKTLHVEELQAML